jgi:hypothetical protein
MQTMHSVRNDMARLPISEETVALFESLLLLPFDLFRPLVDLLLDGSAVIEDLFPAGGDRGAAGRSAAMASDSTGAALRAAALSGEFDEAALRRRVTELLAGRRPGALALPRDGTGVGLMPDGSPAQGYSPPGVSVTGSDSTTSSPSAIETERAGSPSAAAKAAQVALRAALAPKELE